MRLRYWHLFLAFWAIGSLQIPSWAASRIKDVAAFEGVRDNQIWGYGLVVGLNGTGDRSQTIFSTQSLANMLLRSGITIDPDKVRVKNIAAVMVTGNLPPSVRPGSRIDITVSSIGDAQSLQGGVLIMTPLQAANGQIYATAQGQVVLGGFSASGGAGNRVQSNHPTVGRIPSGGSIERDVSVDFNGKAQLHLILNRNDFTTATRAVKAINETCGANVASAVDGRTIQISVPPQYLGRTIEYMAILENARMDIDVSARVVINERTGTIVLGKEVKIDKISIMHGSLSIQIGTLYQISQPEQFSKVGNTTVVPEVSVTAQEDKGKAVTLQDGASVEQIVSALKEMGAGPRDVIAIMQAIKAQGALQAELEII